MSIYIQKCGEKCSLISAVAKSCEWWGVGVRRSAIHTNVCECQCISGFNTAECVACRKKIGLHGHGVAAAASIGWSEGPK